jgi:radical SAM superfamily enzyme YgiQ (UPF0313 family)
MNILLIYPEFPDTFRSFKYALKFDHKKTGAPPLGLLTVAAMLPGEWVKRLIDLNVSSLTSKDLAWADYVFISTMVVQRESVRVIIAQCKAAGVKVVSGGPLFTMEYDQFPDVDYFVLNEEEETLAPFLHDLEEGQAQRIYTSTKFPDNVDGSTNMIPIMGIELLREGYRKILSQIYAPELYYERVLIFLREYQPPKIRVSWEPQYILALWRSIYQLGIRGVERIQYWRLFFWTLLRRPRLFPLAITFAIYGFHFRRVAELHVA